MLRINKRQDPPQRKIEWRPRSDLYVYHVLTTTIMS
jgi:hypothetical protein